MGATGLSADANEYRARLAGAGRRPDRRLGAEMMRDVAIRRGVVRVVDDFRRAAKLTEPEFERVFASGGGPPATVGHDAQGRLIVPAVALWALVPGHPRRRSPTARERLIEYLVANFNELVYV